MRELNIYLCGVGGQGIGLLSEVLTRSCHRAGYKVHGCDTHGLAQRGGTVVSHLRLGEAVFTPLISPGCADIIIGLERLEAWRGAAKMLRTGGTVVYFDAVYQPIDVRMGVNEYVSAEEVESFVVGRGGRVFRVEAPDVPDPRMQNVVLLAKVVKYGLVEGVDRPLVSAVISEVVPKRALEANLRLFESHC